MTDATHQPEGELPTRRDFIHVATAMLGVVGVGAAIWPFIDQMRPDAQTLAAGEPIELDISAVEPGAAIIVTWRGKPYFVRRLTTEELATANALTEGDMKDWAPVETRVSGVTPDGTPGVAGSLGNAGEWVVVSANCTHLGCVPKVVNTNSDGWFCPCHGSVFDFAGRILRGPAATNLPLPPYVFAGEGTLIIGTDQA